MWYYAGIWLNGLNKPLRGNSKYLIENVHLPNKNNNGFRQLATLF